MKKTLITDELRGQLKDSVFFKKPESKKIDLEQIEEVNEDLLANKQTSKEEKSHTILQENNQSTKQESQQNSMQVNNQTINQEKKQATIHLKKFASYLPKKLLKEMKLYAIQND